ncbi:MAG: DinB family protein [Acidithiobacillales bacterium]
MSRDVVSSRVLKLREARDRMVAVREEIYREVQGKSEEELLRPAPDGGWSAAEILDHIGWAERGVAKGFPALEKGQPLKVPRIAWYYRLPMGVAFGKKKFRAPKAVRPRPRVEIRPFEVMESLRGSRRALLDYIEKTGEERFSRIVLPHFILGRFTGLAWLRFIARHEARHLNQLRRVLGGGRPA